MSEEQRNKVLGDDALDDAENFYNLISGAANTPSFRPQIQIPELQTLMLQEANDLSDTAPQIYLSNQGDREKDREKAFQGIWQQAMTPFHIMMCEIMMLFCGNAFAQVGYEPDARNGQGQLWVKCRNPRSVYFDPATDYEGNSSYLILEDYMYVEEVKKLWGRAANNIRLSNSPRQSATAGLASPGYGVQMPDGPMASIGGIANSPQIFSDNRVRVRKVFCLDYTREMAEDKEIPAGAITNPSFAWKYPNGRMLVECQGEILADGDNPFPMKKWPLVQFWAVPPLFGAWSIPATKYTIGMQNFAERLYTGVFENSVRLNNGVWFIDERTGINPEDFGGLPGEVRVINANSPVPQCIWPSPMPQHVIQTPGLLLEMQRKIQGFTAARSGQPGDGNISTDLFDESVMRSQGMTQLRGRLAAVSTQRLAELMFYTVAKFQRRMKVPYSDPNTGMSLVDWTPIARPDTYDVYLDPGSIRPMSQSAIRRLAPVLAKSGALPPGRLLQMLDIPNAAEITKEQQTQLILQALANAGKAKH